MGRSAQARLSCSPSRMSPEFIGSCLNTGNEALGFLAGMSSENPSRRQWRFTWEALAHIPTLRLYLFRPGTDPSACCRSLSASLRLDLSLLLVSWLRHGGEGDEAEGEEDEAEGEEAETEGEEEVLLRVPVPRVLIDPAVPVQCIANSDHIEIKLTLVLPVDHPVVMDFRAALDSEGEESVDGEGALELSERLTPLSLDSDLTKLCSGDGHVYCRTCSEKLTRQPLRRFVEMPSVNWREVADNWFGACCCSFGGASEKMVARYISSRHCTEGTCLLDSASLIIYKDDLDICSFVQPLVSHSSVNQVDSLAHSTLLGAVDGYFSSGLTPDIINGCSSLNFAPNKVGLASADLSASDNKKHTNALSFPLLSPQDPCKKQNSSFKETADPAQLCLAEALINTDKNLQKLNLNHCFDTFEKPFQEPCNDILSKNHDHCCGDETNSPDRLKSNDSLGSQESENLIRNSSLGGGFLARASNNFNDIEWICFSCKKCSSKIGSFPSFKNLNTPVDGSMRLFKCSISTSPSKDGVDNIFRKYTFERVFVNLLLEGAEEELSYRVIVRDLVSKSPKLQLVLTSSNAWWSSGYCIENASMKLLPADLLPVLKVLYSECSFASKEKQRILKDWSTKKHADEVYMMPYLIEELSKCLKAASNKLPLSCSSLEGMSLSSLNR